MWFSPDVSKCFYIEFCTIMYVFEKFRHKHKLYFVDHSPMAFCKFLQYSRKGSILFETGKTNQQIIGNELMKYIQYPYLKSWFTAAMLLEVLGNVVAKDGLPVRIGGRKANLDVSAWKVWACTVGWTASPRFSSKSSIRLITVCSEDRICSFSNPSFSIFWRAKSRAKSRELRAEFSQRGEIFWVEVFSSRMSGHMIKKGLSDAWDRTLRSKYLCHTCFISCFLLLSQWACCCSCGFT